MAKVLEVKSACCGPEYASELPAGSILRGRKFKHIYLVTDQAEVVRISDGKTVEERMKTSNYDVLPPGSTISFEV